MNKFQYLTRWTDQSCYQVVDRSRVAYLLRAARSRGETIHVICGPYKNGYQLGNLAIVVQQSYHRRLIAAS